jgi:hypothetical protein
VPGLKETLARIALRDDGFISLLSAGQTKAVDLDWSKCRWMRLAAPIGLALGFEPDPALEDNDQWGERRR